MILECYAIIHDDEERRMVREQVVKKLATSYTDDDNAKILHATYHGNNESTVDELVAVFEKYNEHNITKIGKH